MNKSEPTAALNMLAFPLMNITGIPGRSARPHGTEPVSRRRRWRSFFCHTSLDTNTAYISVQVVVNLTE
jgi:hypothetical protein